MHIEEEIILLREAVARIETRLESMTICPNPGACNKIEPRVRALESAEDQRKGGWWVLAVGCTVAGTVGGWIAKVLWKQ